MSARQGHDRVVCGQQTIAYDITYSRRRTVGITVLPAGEVHVAAPLRMSAAQVRRLVVEKAGWIERKLGQFRADGCHDVTKRYLDGEQFLYLGEEYRLRLLAGEHGPLVTLGAGRLNAILPPGADGRQAEMARKVVYDWYKFHAGMAIDRAIGKYSGRLGIWEPDYKLKNLSRRWGSCTTDNRLSFNVKIVMAPLPQLEYVVAHELCHVKVKDHSPRFWALLESVMPGYKESKKALKRDGWKYEL